MLLHKALEEGGYSLILASQSPRRRDLIRDCGLDFRTARYEVDEIYPSTLAAEDVAEYLSVLKCDGYPEELGAREILITADTVVLLGDSVLGKPQGADGAREMLRTLSGREHRVVTGVTLRGLGRKRSFSVVTKVQFAALSEEQIEYYVESYKPMDKAGSYGIQEWIGYVGIESIEGSFYNVMGLPIQRLYSELSEFISK